MQILKDPSSSSIFLISLFASAHRVYPEPWQVVLQTVKTGKNGANYVEDTVVYASDKRPSYNEAVAKLLEKKISMTGQ
jgi:hypothetical protein